MLWWDLRFKVFEVLMIVVGFSKIEATFFDHGWHFLKIKILFFEDLSGVFKIRVDFYGQVGFFWIPRVTFKFSIAHTFFSIKIFYLHRDHFSLSPTSKFFRSHFLINLKIKILSPRSFFTFWSLFLLFRWHFFRKLRHSLTKSTTPPHKKSEAHDNLSIDQPLTLYQKIL